MGKRPKPRPRCLYRAHHLEDVPIESCGTLSIDSQFISTTESERCSHCQCRVESTSVCQSKQNRGTRVGPGQFERQGILRPRWLGGVWKYQIGKHLIHAGITATGD